jgi:TP901 family phage tail tape measure protein
MSTRRDLIYRMTADPEGFKKGMREAGKDSRLFYKELKALEQQQQAVDDVTTATGATLLGFGAAAATGLALATKAAIDWESAWTGVTKVVNGSPEQLAALEDELRGLATTLPQTHAEIAGVAAAAGQLGIAREDIADFTSTMVAMGVSTDIASEDAAMGMARLMNIMQTAPDEVANLGSAIVGLGNAGASTESEIMEMALRIAGAGHTVGMSEAEVLSFSSALASVGIEAESGGSSISTAMIKISEAVAEGGESLDGFAQVAGVTADEFAQKFSSDPAAAIDMFVQGLGRIQSSGGDVFGTLESLGMSEIRLRDALLRLAGAGDLLTESLTTGNEAWQENSALTDEAARRYETTEAQMAIAKNQLVDIGITLGDTLVPILRDFLDAGSGLLEFFSGLPGPVQQTAVALGAAVAVIGVLGGAALIAVPKIHEFNRTLGEIGTTGALRVQRGLNAVTSILTGPWGIALGATIAVLTAFAAKQGEAESRVKEFAGTLDKETGQLTKFSREWVAMQLVENDDFGQAFIDDMRTMGIETSLVTDAILGVPGAMEELNQKLDASGYTLAAEDWKQRIAELSGEVEQGKSLQEAFMEATEGASQATSDAADSTQHASAEAMILADNLGITTGAAEDASAAFDDLEERVRALIDSAFALNGVQRDVEEGIDNITEKLEENGATIDRNTEAGRENEALIEEQVAAIAQLALTMAEQTGSAEEANAVLDEQRDRLHDVLKAAGLTEEQIDSYISVLDAVPSEIETVVETSGLSAAIRGAQSLGTAIHNIPSYKRVVIQYSQEGRNAPSGDQEYADGGYVPGFADGGIPGFPSGGMFRGRGGPREDANIIAVSDGEFIVNAASTKRHRALLEAINSGKKISTVNRAPIHESLRHGMGGSGATARVWFDFSNVGDDFARAIKNTVRLDGGGDVQAAFGER